MKISKVLSDIGRVKKLRLLQQKSMSACEIRMTLGLGHHTARNRLKTLDDAGRVTCP